MPSKVLPFLQLPNQEQNGLVGFGQQNITGSVYPLHPSSTTSIGPNVRPTIPLGRLLHRSVLPFMANLSFAGLSILGTECLVFLMNL